jgi:hypothetical protein
MYGNDTGHIWIFADETGFKHVVLRLFAMTVQIDCSIFFLGWAETTNQTTVWV